MTRWTMAQVERQAPDAAARAAAKRLARPGPWSDTGSTETLVWGKCQGSGAAPYQVSVDLIAPTFRCSCPSRKLPCKHALALLMLWVANEGSLAEGIEPAPSAPSVPSAGAATATAGEAQRRGRSARCGPAVDADTEAVGADALDPEARARRLARRLDLMSNGMADFAVWLCDVVAAGLAACRQRPYAFWDAAAARLVDAQLPGLAERVRAMGSDVHRRADWADHLLAELGRWFLATEAWGRRDGLPSSELGDLRAFIGWPVAAEERAPTPADRWTVLGVHRTDDGRLQAQRTWLAGAQAPEPVVVLDFAAVGGALRVAQVVGSVIDAAPAAYPGSGPRRVLLPDDATVVATASSLPAAEGVAASLGRAARWWARNPWLDRVPLSLRAVRIEPGPATGGAPTGWVVDTSHDGLPLSAGTDPWPLLARTGGHPVELFGELEDGAFRPLTLALPGELVAV